MTQKTITPDITEKIRNEAAAKRVAIGTDIALIRKGGLSCRDVKKVAGDIIERNKQELIRQIREEYKAKVQKRYNQSIRVLLSKHRTMKILSELGDIAADIANGREITLFFCAGALGDLFPFFSADGAFSLGGERYFSVRKLTEILERSHRNTIENVIKKHRVSFIKVFSPGAKTFVKFYKFSEICKKCAVYRHRVAAFEKFSKTNFLNALKKQRPDDLQEMHLIALAVIILTYDQTGIWLNSRELTNQMIMIGYPNKYVLEFLTRKGYVRFKNQKTKFNSHEPRALEISSKCPHLLTTKTTKCLEPGCCGGKTHLVFKDYVFDARNEFKEKLKKTI